MCHKAQVALCSTSFTAAIHPFLYYVFFIKPPSLWCMCVRAHMHVRCICMCAVCVVCAVCEFKYAKLCTWKSVDNLGASLSLPSCFWGIVSSFLISTECTSLRRLCASRKELAWFWCPPFHRIVRVTNTHTKASGFLMWVPGIWTLGPHILMADAFSAYLQKTAFHL